MKTKFEVKSFLSENREVVIAKYIKNGFLIFTN